jgi:peroxiredoxin
LSIEVGQRPPDFQLPDQDRKLRALKDFLGRKTVLAFFPGAFTSVCTKEMCAFRDSMQTLNGLNAQVVGISVNDPWTNNAFTEANKLQFPILGDYTREVVKKFNVFHNDFGGLIGYTVAKRSIFVLDANGVLRYRWVSEDPGKQPNYDEVKDVLARI